jgi:hypothetical protein
MFRSRMSSLRKTFLSFNENILGPRQYLCQAAVGLRGDMDADR